MPSTSYTDATMGVREIGGRTDAAGVAVDDLPLDQDRMINHVLTEGWLTDGAFAVVEDSPASMTVVVGSGTAKSDLYVVEGDDDGQHPYLVRLDAASVDVTLDAADGSNPRIDEIWLVVADDAYDSGGVSLPRLAVRKGDAAASPSAPGPDGAWKAAVLLASVDVGSSVSSVDDGDITDERSRVGLHPTLASEVDAFDSGSVSSGSTLGPLVSDIESVDVEIPAGWMSWTIHAVATLSIFSDADGSQVAASVKINGTDGEESANVADNLFRASVSCQNRITGTDTGPVTVAIAAKNTGGDDDYAWSIYARAVRTS